MDMSAYLDNIKLQVTGGLLACEVDDKSLEKIVNISLREIQRYINSTKMITIPYHECIDLSEFKVSSVYKVFRANTYSDTKQGLMDPLYMTQWQMLAGLGNGLVNSDWVYNYGAWNTALQIKNTISTDLAYVYDKSKEYLYINTANDIPDKITIEFIPRYDSVEEITSDYWIDKLCRMSVAYTKIAIGRIRSKFTQTNALWTLDGAQMLEEGNTELSQLREDLVANNNLMRPVD